jgi:competence protein ComEA
MLRYSFTRIALLFFALCLIAPGLLAKKKPPEAPVNLNTATSEELQLVPGIGPVTAEKILQMRKSYGAFKSVDDLTAIRGIGPKRLEKMRKYLTVGKAASAGKPSSPAKSAPPPNPAASGKALNPPKPSAGEADPPCFSL